MTTVECTLIGPSGHPLYGYVLEAWQYTGQIERGPDGDPSVPWWVWSDVQTEQGHLVVSNGIDVCMAAAGTWLIRRVAVDHQVVMIVGEDEFRDRFHVTYLNAEK